MSRRVCIATLHTGNTLTIHSQTFFKGRPQLVTDEALVDYLKDHPNFTVEMKVVRDTDSSAQIIAEAKAQLRKETTYAAPVVGENTAADAGAAVVAPSEPTTEAKSPVKSQSPKKK